MDDYKDFNEYLAYFRKQSIKDKKSIIIDQLFLIDRFTTTMCKNLNIKSGSINKNINKLSSSEDEYLENLIIMINSIQDSLCSFSDKFTDIMDYASNK